MCLLEFERSLRACGSSFGLYRERCEGDWKNRIVEIQRYNYPSGFIGRAFDWEASPEGYSYWQSFVFKMDELVADSLENEVSL